MSCVVRKNKSLQKQKSLVRLQPFFFGRNHNYFVVFLDKIVIVTKFTDSNV